MNFDNYWENLIKRIYHQKEILSGDEEIFYRLSCIYGETMVDGIEAYFDRRFLFFDKDMRILEENGFTDIASDFKMVRKIMFGDAPLEEKVVQEIYMKLLDEDKEFCNMQEKIDKIYNSLISRLDKVAEYRYQFGLNKGLYKE